MKFVKSILIPLSLFLSLLLVGCAAREMSGIVFDKKGNTIPEVYVQVKEVHDLKNTKQVLLSVDKTDMGGNFEVKNLKRYKTYSLNFSKKSYEDKDILYDLRTMPKKELKSLRIELNEVGLINGTVIDKEGNGIPFVFIEAKTDSGEYVATTTTDEMGNFSLTGLEGDKTYKLAFSKYGYVPKNDVEFNLSKISEIERTGAKIRLLREIVEIKGKIMKLGGTSGETLFIMNSEFRKYLDSSIMTSELLDAFNAQNIELRETSVIWDADSQIWWIVGKDSSDGNQLYYAVKMENDDLKVYNSIYVPFVGLKVELIKSGADPLLTWEATTDSEGKFNISEQITSGAFRIKIINDGVDNKYMSEKSVPSDTEYFRLEAGDSMDIGILTMDPLPSVESRGIEPEEPDLTTPDISPEPTTP